MHTTPMPEEQKEQIALFDTQGKQVGTKERAAAERDRDRVGLCFVWAAYTAPDNTVRMLLQTRSRPGDPYLGSLDSPAAGHIQADEYHGETARREFAEEVGVELDPTELVFLGQLHLEDPSERYLRHAMQFFYLCTRPIALDETVFNKEVSAFVEVTLADFDDLVSGRSASIQGQTRYEETPNEIRPQEITPAAFADYPEQIMHAIRRSAYAIDAYLKNDQVDAAIWSSPTG